MQVEDKVRVLYTDAIGNKIVWDGVIKEKVSDGMWRVQCGGVAIVFKEADIMEIKNDV